LNAINDTEATNQIDNKAYKGRETRPAPVGPKLEQRLSMIQAPKTSQVRTHLYPHSARRVGPIKIQGREKASGPLRSRIRGEGMACGEEKDG